MATTLRLATTDDAQALQHIYAPYVRETVISFELEAPSVDEMHTRIEKTLAVYPWLICQQADGTIAGYAYATKHRERAAYQWSVDVSVYVDPNRHRFGVGRGLYTALFKLLQQQGFYNAYAGIALPNDASIGVHTALGFEPVGIYRHVGYKLGEWHDVAWLALTLQEPATVPTTPIPLPEIVGSPEFDDALRAGVPLIRL